MEVLAEGRLPVDMTSLVGRHAEVAELKQLLSESRLVTLVGPGGVGKTRLALQVAREARRAFPGGTWWVSLAEVSEPGLVALTVMDAVGLRTVGPDATTSLIEFLQDKRLLVVLDNCEHLVAACGELAMELLSACPGVQVLATSREVLDIAGEWTFMVAPLSLPAEGSSPSGLDADAVALFADRAAAAVPGFEVTSDNIGSIAALCRQLDGLPLAIELAAVRARVLSIEELLKRQGEHYELLTRRQRSIPPARHHSLRATVDWSFELCGPQEQLLWARLSVFAGGCDLAAAESVCADEDLTRGEVLDVLAGLVEKSILTREEAQGRPRYRMLETIRQYGRERLRRADEEALLRERHRDYYLELAEQLQERWFGPSQVALFASMRDEHANLRAAIEYCLTEPGQARVAMHMASSLWIYWIVCGLPREGGLWLERALACDAEPSRPRAEALWAASLVSVYGGNPSPATVDEVLAMMEECRILTEQFDDPEMQAHATYLAGFAQLRGSDPMRGFTMLTEGVELERAFGESNPHLRFAQFMLAIVANRANLSDMVLAVGEECRDACRARGDQWIQSWIVLVLGIVSVLQDRTEVAVGQLREAIQLKQPFSELLGIGCSVEMLAWCAVATGDNDLAAKLFGSVSVFLKPLGLEIESFAPQGEWKHHRDHDMVVQRTKDALGEPAFVRAYQEGTQLTHSAAIALALETVAAEPATSSAGRSLLTRREEQIARLLAEGLSNKDIAQRLVISQRTAETHVANVLSKLGLSSRTQVASWVLQQRGDASV